MRSWGRCVAGRVLLTLVSLMVAGCGGHSPAGPTRTGARGVANAHQGDGNADGKIVIDELTSYIAAWKQGTYDDINLVTNAISLWKGGEAYHYDASVSPPYVAGASTSGGTNATVLPGQDQTVTTPDGQTVAIPGTSVQTETAVQVTVDAQPDLSGLGDSTITAAGAAVTVTPTSGQITGSFTVTGTGTPGFDADGVLRYPLLNGPDGPFVPAAWLVSTANGRYTVTVPAVTDEVLAAAQALAPEATSRRATARGNRITSYTVVLVAVKPAQAAACPDYTYQLGPLAPTSTYSPERLRFTDGYGVTATPSQVAWPTTGRVAIVIHGINNHPDVWQKPDAQGVSFVDFLRNDLGYAAVWGFHYYSQQGIAGNAQKLATILGKLPWGNGQQVDIFGHSMGGLVSRYAMERILDPSYVARVITLGTPHQGSPLAGYQLKASDLFFGLTTGAGNLAALLFAAGLEFVGDVQAGVQDMKPGSSFLTTLNGANVNGRRPRSTTPWPATSTTSGRMPATPGCWRWPAWPAMH